MKWKKKKEIKNQLKLVNSQNLQPELWDHNNSLENKPTNNYDYGAEFPTHLVLKDEVEKKKVDIKNRGKTQVNMADP